jgi:UPF0755 protein
MSQLGLGMTEDDEDLWQQGSGPRRRRGGPAVLLAALVVAALVFAAGFFSIRWITAGEDFTGDGSGQVVVQVTKGETLRGIGEALTDAGVVRSVDAFTSAAAAEPRSKGIAPGGYLMRLGMSGEAAVAWMLDPASRDTSKVVVPEGLRMSQIVTAVAKATGLSDDAMQDALSRAPALGLPDGAEGVPEGYLFPATYEFPRGVSADDVVRTMIARAKPAPAEAALAHGAEARGLTPHQVRTVASLVQGESGIDDYPKVARVIYNRLAKDMKLQLDSTVNYGLGTSDLHLSAEQLASDTPYNTYVHAGLPPTPIGAPGQQANEAAHNPAKGKRL